MDASYRNSFIGLAALSSLLLMSQPTRRSALVRGEAQDEKKDSNSKKQAAPAKNHPQTDLYKTYFFVAVSFWFQEMFLNTLYRKDYKLSSSMVTSLYITSFAASGITSVFAGAAADHYGRKSISVVFAACYGASSCLAMVPQVPVLFLGRVLGGVGTAILFSALDSWVVADFFTRKLTTQGCELYRTFGTLGVINAFAAVACCVLGDRLIWLTSSTKAPLTVSWLVMWQAMQAIWASFRETYGASASGDSEVAKNTPTLSTVFKRPFIWALTLATTVFEGSMCLLALNALPLIESNRRTNKELPQTYILACIMASTLAGALFFNIVMSRRKFRFVRLMTFVLVAANFVFFRLSRSWSEHGTFLLLCSFGALTGLYWPCMSVLKARMIEEGIRATVYSLIRVPLYVFIIGNILYFGPVASKVRLLSTCSMFFTAAFGAIWTTTFYEQMP